MDRIAEIAKALNVADPRLQSKDASRNEAAARTVEMIAETELLIKQSRELRDPQFVTVTDGRRSE